MFQDLDLAPLRHMPEIAFYFRYPLHHADFHEVRARGRLLGRYAAKPLHGRLTPQGRVDRSSSYNGQIAVIFLSPRAKSVRSARLLLTRMPASQVIRPDGRRNWPAIRAAAERAIRRAVSRKAAFRRRWPYVDGESPIILLAALAATPSGAGTAAPPR